MQYYNEYDVQGKPTPGNTAAVNGQPKVISNAGLGVAKVFLWFALGLVLTGGACMGYPFLISALFGTGDNGMSIYLYSSLAFLVISIFLGMAVTFSGFATKHSGLIKTFYILYTLTFGLGLSVVQWALEDVYGSASYGYILYSFLISAGSFALMGFLGYITKGKIGRPVMYLLAFVVGLSVIALINYFFFRTDALYWAISILMFVIILLVSAVDINRVLRKGNELAKQENETLAVYEAYCLYSDFVIIFYYVLRVVLLFANNKN